MTSIKPSNTASTYVSGSSQHKMNIQSKAPVAIQHNHSHHPGQNTGNAAATQKPYIVELGASKAFQAATYKNPASNKPK